MTVGNRTAISESRRPAQPAGRRRRRPLLSACAALVIGLSASPASADTVTSMVPTDFAALVASAPTGKEPGDLARGRSLGTSLGDALGRLPGGAVDVRERERPDRGGRNDETRVAELVPRFGTSARFQDVHIHGVLADVDGSEARVGPFPEDDGAIPLAAPLGLTAALPAVRVAATIGDGPHGVSGDGTGDFDFYAVRAAAAGWTLTVDVDARAIGSGLDAVVAVTDATGAIIAFNDDSPELDSFLQVELPADGDYFVAVAAFGSLPANPFDSASGNGARTEGAYELAASFEFAQDVDVYGVDLRRGDVLGVAASGAARVLAVVDRTGIQVMGSGRNQSVNYSDGSPLVMAGNTTLDHVAARSGRHYVVVSRGVGAYQVDLLVRRPALDTASRGERQILFLDFDGAFVDPSTFGTDSGDLSPLADFLAGWGLSPQDESALIDAVQATVVENLVRDPAERGGNRRFDVEIRNSRDHADAWGQPNVTRIVIGGTRAQLGFDTVGLAPGVDPGNFAREETVVVLLDQLSSPAGSGLATINDFAFPGVDVIGLVGQTLGFVASHEAGHALGNHHTAPGNGVTSLMDTRDIDQLGLGPDLMFGTADDVDVDFVTDDLIEGFVGAEDTLTRVAFALSSGRRGHS